MSGRIKINKYPSFDDKEWAGVEELGYFVHPTGFVKSKKYFLNKRRRERTTKEKILSMFTIKGYLTVNLVNRGKRKSVRVHRLVAKAFIENGENKPCVNHEDGVKTNNNVNNLSWCTYSENEKHSYNSLNKISPAKKIFDKDHKLIIKMHSNGFKQTTIAKKFGVSSSAISYHLRNYYGRK